MSRWEVEERSLVDVSVLRKRGSHCEDDGVETRLFKWEMLALVFERYTGREALSDCISDFPALEGDGMIEFLQASGSFREPQKRSAQFPCGRLKL